MGFLTTLISVFSSNRSTREVPGLSRFGLSGVSCAKYLKYLIEHKTRVLVECSRFRKPIAIYASLLWRALIHDLSKFRPDEFVPYARWFFDERTDEVKTEGRKAYELHRKRNRHHPSYWKGEMPDLYCLECAADVTALGKQQGFGFTRALEWRRKNPDMWPTLSQESKERIDQYIKELDIRGSS